MVLKFHDRTPVKPSTSGGGGGTTINITFPLQTYELSPQPERTYVHHIKAPQPERLYIHKIVSD